jgi:plasmid stability protein
MAQFVVRNLEQSLKDRLQRRAKRNGRSMEEEVREILRGALNRSETFGRLRDPDRSYVCRERAQF